MLSRNKGVLLLLIVLVASGLAAYVFTTSTAPQELVGVTITIPSKQWHFLWAYAGVEAGIYAEEGIDLEIVVTRPAPTGVQAVIGGSAQFTATGESAVLAMLRGADLKIVAIPIIDANFYFISRAEFLDVDDLRGRKVAVSRTHSMIGAVTREILELHGLDPDTDLELTSIGSNEERLAALQQGSIDAAIFVAPHNIVAEESGLNVLLYSADALPRKIINPLVTSQRMIEEEPETVRKMVKATVLSIEYLLEQPENAIDIAMNVFDVGEDRAWETYDLVNRDWGYGAPLQDVQNLFEVENGFLEEPVEFDVQDWIDYTFVNEALEELGMETVLASIAPRTFVQNPFLRFPHTDQVTRGKPMQKESNGVETLEMPYVEI
ncbi:MAG: ABC transporter substrate-binding protein [Thermoplasmata archaeon]